ncbi:MAG: protease modulator HflC [Candidatus Aureabacteria bacterium]|nr:protease modulator HflC [Candidatus Auribacterota bacterium]
MKIALGIVLALIIIVGVVFMSGLVYVISETQQVVITQFGEPIGNPITSAGLHFKMPLIQQAHYFDKRLLETDGEPNQIPTKDKKYLWVDTTARWRIADALKLLQAVRGESGAHQKLDDIINSATRNAISTHALIEVVRDSNRIIEAGENNKGVIVTDEALKRIGTGREKIEGIILEQAKELAPDYGIELVDVRIKRLNYIETVRKSVYQRMITERNRAAEKFRSEGEGKRAEIDGKREKELKLITSEAYRKAQGVKGKADAEATKIYAAAYSRDPEFYSLIKTLETYQKTIDEGTTLILTTDDDYYRYLKGVGSPDSK